MRQHLYDIRMKEMRQEEDNFNSIMVAQAEEQKLKEEEVARKKEKLHLEMKDEIEQFRSSQIQGKIVKS